MRSPSLAVAQMEPVDEARVFISRKQIVLALMLLVPSPTILLIGLGTMFQILVLGIGILVFAVVFWLAPCQVRRLPGWRWFCLINVLLIAVGLVFLALPFAGMNSNVAYLSFGSVTSHSITVLCRFPDATSFKIHLANSTKEGRISDRTDFIVMNNFSELTSNTTYEVKTEFLTNETWVTGASGSFKTLPDGNSFSFASTSCLQRGRVIGGRTSKSIFEIVPNKNPDFLLFLGDIIYADVPFGLGFWGIGYGSNVKLYKDDYLGTAAAASPLLSKIPIFWMYDDHEIVNDYASGFENSQFQTAIKAWRQYIGNVNPNPNIAFPDRMYYWFSAGIHGFFVLDTRYFRHEATQTLVGQVQLEQLEMWLLSMPFDGFKFIVSPVSMTKNVPESDGGWNMAPLERDHILNFIKTRAIKKCVFVTGDEHKTGVYLLAPDIYEVAASPLDAFTKSWHGDIDPTLYEDDSMTSVFALFTIEEDRLTVDIYGGGVPHLLLQSVAVSTLVSILAVSCIFGRLFHSAFEVALCGIIIAVLHGMWTHDMHQDFNAPKFSIII